MQIRARGWCWVGRRDWSEISVWIPNIWGVLDESGTHVAEFCRKVMSGRKVAGVAGGLTCVFLLYGRYNNMVRKGEV